MFTLSQLEANVHAAFAAHNIARTQATFKAAMDIYEAYEKLGGQLELHAIVTASCTSLSLISARIDEQDGVSRPYYCM